MSHVVRRIGHRLKRAQHALRIRLDEALQEVGLTTPQYAALAALELDGPLSGAELARRCFVTPQTMHPIVTKLEREGFVVRRDLSESSRIIETHLTDLGRTALADGHRRAGAVEEEMLVGFRPGERDRLAEALDLVRKNLEGMEA